MDAADKSEKTYDRGALRAITALLVLLLVLLGSASLAQAQSPANPRPISPPSSALERDQNGDETSQNGRSLFTTVAALGAILLLFFGLVQVWRRYSPTTANQTLPSTAWEVLGSAPLDNKHQLMVVRLGSRLLVLGRSDDGLQTLSEITSGDEVSQLVALCQSANQPVEQNSFRQLYETFRTQIGAPASVAPDPQSSTTGETHRA